MFAGSPSEGAQMIIKGVGIGRGVAVGPVLRMADPLPEPEDVARDASVSAQKEQARVKAALDSVNADLSRRAEEARNGDEGTKQAAEILDAISMFAADPQLAASINALIEQGKTGERAVLEGFGAIEEMFRAIGGYQGERAADLHDVGQRVIAELMQLPAPGVPDSEQPFVLVAKDLSPADTASLDLNKTLAIVTSEGGPTSHTAILARARGIVAVVSAPEAADLVNGQQVIVNAAKGEVTVDPTPEQIEQAEQARAKADRAKELRGQPGQLKDGTRIPLLANVGKPADAKAAHEYGAEGVGLFRTEFLFIGNSEPPSVEEQTKAYADLLREFPGQKVVIRMLDAGADKPLPFLTPEDEPNPALGLRGLRTLEAHREVLENQLKALAAADAQTDADLWVMAPMVADRYEAEWFVNLGKSYGLKFVGAMAEVPSIALMADQVAQVADFVSIGTNDLTQYTMAADRTLGSVSNYQTAWHPAVLRAIKMICEAGNNAGMPVGVCGEAAADPDLAVVLVGMGVNSLSMTPVALDDVRAELAEHTLEEAKELAARALNGEFYKPEYWN
ncbi:phosphoenolpyruvate-protein phosphotransferase [Bifidobacterium gallicum DSM 20093 = LMG 11596]|uniref:Phosphoenolpyruvate-protein phosphotransferase n=2 Tax=Bifidobacterium gallicum DSM 20093 = LMG 11596 TaxID=561180 RepID=D1NVU7_9BIFI|nr:phosphoenolpyruvate-protein phosphotransferase [Bifidobacterium gallicum DSM 20093 = LMG 11596]